MVPFSTRCATGALMAAILAPFVGACGDLEIHSVYTSLDQTGARRRTAFFTDSKSIFCDADYASSRMDITFNATIRQTFDPKAGAVPAAEPKENADIVMAIGELSPGVGHGIMSMEWTRPMDPSGMGGTLPFPAGWYRCEYYVDGIDPATGVRSTKKVIQGTVAFKVDYILCPVAGAFPGTSCRGYVAPVNPPTCKGVDANKTYKCDDVTGVWVPL